MYKKVMVPLDGSQFSECSLEHMKAIASGCNVPEVILLRVVEPLSTNETAALAQARGMWSTRGEHERKAGAAGYSDVDYPDAVSAKMGENRAKTEISEQAHPALLRTLNEVRTQLLSN